MVVEEANDRKQLLRQSDDNRQHWIRQYQHRPHRVTLSGIYLQPPSSPSEWIIDLLSLSIFFLLHSFRISQVTNTTMSSHGPANTSFANTRLAPIEPAAVAAAAKSLIFVIVISNDFLLNARTARLLRWRRPTGVSWLGGAALADLVSRCVEGRSKAFVVWSSAGVAAWGRDGLFELLVALAGRQRYLLAYMTEVKHYSGKQQE